jgi:hypothetical protein
VRPATARRSRTRRRTRCRRSRRRLACPIDTTVAYHEAGPEGAIYSASSFMQTAIESSDDECSMAPAVDEALLRARAAGQGRARARGRDGRGGPDACARRRADQPALLPVHGPRGQLHLLRPRRRRGGLLCAAGSAPLCARAHELVLAVRPRRASPLPPRRARPWAAARARPARAAARAGSTRSSSRSARSRPDGRAPCTAPHPAVDAIEACCDCHISHPEIHSYLFATATPFINRITCAFFSSDTTHIPELHRSISAASLQASTVFVLSFAYTPSETVWWVAMTLIDPWV